VDFSEHSGILAVKHCVNTLRPLTTPPRLALLLLGAILWSGQAFAVTPADQPIITSLSVVGANLVFNATVPSGVDQAMLELRATVDAAWQEAALLDVPKDGGDVEFTIPRPALDMAFFRLKATTHATTNAQLSAELQYVTIPPLGPAVTNATPGTDAVFHFKGVVDGSDRILITRAGAFWEHVNWDWPAARSRSMTRNGIPGKRIT